MRICRLEDVEEEEIIEQMRAGALFIYPTDTIYGIGCNALKKSSVQLIRSLKRTDHPFSVIAPSKAWIHEHLRVRHAHYLKRLPGKFTIIFEKKRTSFLRDCSREGLGVRMPRHSITALVKESRVPFVTTSVNVSGKRPIQKIASIPKHFLKKVDVVIDGGSLSGRSSRVFDLTGEKPRRLR